MALSIPSDDDPVWTAKGNARAYACIMSTYTGGEDDDEGKGAGERDGVYSGQRSHYVD